MMGMISCKECNNPISSKADSCPKCGAKVKRTGVLKIVWYVFLALIVVPMIFAAFLPSSRHTSSPVAAPTTAETPAKLAPSATTLADLSLDFRPQISGFGNIALISGSITNSGPTDVKDIVVECESSAASGTVLDHNKRTLYETVRAGEKHKFKELNMGLVNSQVKSTSCGIIGFKPD